MYVRAYRAANTAAQEARAMRAAIAKQQQAVTKESQDLVRRLDVKGQNARLLELHAQHALIAADAEAARTKSLTAAVASVASAVGAAAVAAGAIGKRMLDRLNGDFNAGEAARMQEEAGRSGKGTARLAMAEFKLKRAQEDYQRIHNEVEQKKARSWFPGLGPSLRDMKRLTNASLRMTDAQQRVYELGGQMDVPSLEDRKAPHLQSDATKPPVVPPRPEATTPPAGVPAPAAGTPSVSPPAVAGTPQPAEQAPFVPQPAEQALPTSQPAPAQPDVTAADGTMPAAVKWGGQTGAQPLPFDGAKVERLHQLKAEAEHGTLTKAKILANRDLFSPQDLIRLQGAFLAEMGAEHNGAPVARSAVQAQLDQAIDQAIGYGKPGELTPAMREAFLHQAATNVLDAAEALKQDPSEANRKVYEDARRTYDDIKYGNLTGQDFWTDMLGLVHRLGGEMKQTFEPVSDINLETGAPATDVVTQLMGAVELARDTAEEAQKQSLAAQDQARLAAAVIAEIHKAESEAGLYGTGSRTC